jgi:hypothetical protein
VTFGNKTTESCRTHDHILLSHFRPPPPNLEDQDTACLTPRNRVAHPSAELIKHYAMKAYGGVDVYTHVFLTYALVDEWLASRPSRFIPGEAAPGTP